MFATMKFVSHPESFTRVTLVAFGSNVRFTGSLPVLIPVNDLEFVSHKRGIGVEKIELC